MASVSVVARVTVPPGTAARAAAEACASVVPVRDVSPLARADRVALSYGACDGCARSSRPRAAHRERPTTAQLTASLPVLLMRYLLGCLSGSREVAAGR